MGELRDENAHDSGRAMGTFWGEEPARVVGLFLGLWGWRLLDGGEGLVLHVEDLHLLVVGASAWGDLTHDPCVFTLGL